MRDNTINTQNAAANDVASNFGKQLCYIFSSLLFNKQSIMKVNKH